MILCLKKCYDGTLRHCSKVHHILRIASPRNHIIPPGTEEEYYKYLKDSPDNLTSCVVPRQQMLLIQDCGQRLAFN